ncbi:MAG: dTMP kinase [Chitinispirillaceae bacterium]|nr:dTMP kinase [Chitinispirillaceae bacterium]
MPGLFVVFDGIDGCGKSTQLDLAAKRLSRRGYDVLTTREPGGTPLAEAIRALVLSPEHDEMCSECELLLYGASRAQHVREAIMPALQRGVVVLCDRFDIATLAYQGYGRSIPFSTLLAINELATGGLAPDLTFVFSIPVEKAFERLQAMRKQLDRLEGNDTVFFERVADGYRELAANNPDTVVLLDAMKPVTELEEAVFKEITARLSGK